MNCSACVCVCTVSWPEVHKTGCETAAKDYISQAGVPRGRGVCDSCKQSSGIWSLQYNGSSPHRGIKMMHGGP